MSDVKYCSKTVEQPLFYGSYKDGCAKIARHTDAHGNNLCEKYYNKWKKKIDKSKQPKS